MKCALRGKLGARNSKLETRKNETNADKHQYRT
jgi:hypothetical protein